jgi:hypothetical protein
MERTFDTAKEALVHTLIELCTQNGLQLISADGVCQRYSIVIEGQCETISILTRDSADGVFVIVSSLTRANVRPNVVVYTLDMADLIVTEPSDSMEIEGITIKYDSLIVKLRHSVLNALIGHLGPPTACILGMPDITLSGIMSYCNVQEICAATSTSKRLAVICQHDLLWDDLWRSEFLAAEEPDREPPRQVPLNRDFCFDGCLTFNSISKRTFCVLWNERVDKRKAEEAERKRHQQEILRYLGRSNGHESRQQFYYSTTTLALPQMTLPLPSVPSPTRMNPLGRNPFEPLEASTPLPLAHRYGSGDGSSRTSSSDSSSGLQLPFERTVDPIVSLRRLEEQAPLRSMYFF